MEKSYSSQKLSINSKESFAANVNIQIVDLRQEIFFCKMYFLSVANP